MAGNLSLKVTGRELLRQKFAALVKEHGLLTREQTAELANYCCNGFARVTEPFGMGAAAKRTGDAMVKGDIHRTVQGISKPFWDHLTRRGIDRQDRNKTVYWRRDGEMRSIVLGWLDMDIGQRQLKAYHNRHRRYGRVKYPVPESEALATADEIRDRFIEDSQKMVGLAKAGWLAARNDRVGKRYSPPKWLRQNISRSIGWQQDAGDPERQYSVHVHNNVSYVSHILRKGKINQGLSEGHRLYLRQWEKKNEKLAREFGK